MTKVSVTQPDAAGKLHFGIAKNELVSTSAVKDEIVKAYADKGVDAFVDCGSDESIAVDEGTTFSCTATDANGGSKTIVAVAHPTGDDVAVDFS